MKKGFTFISLIIYVMIFFTFLVISSSMVTNINKKNFKDRGNIEVNNEYLKLYSNMFSSAKASKDISYIDDTYVFSNGDSYFFDNVNNIIRKNDFVLCRLFSSKNINSEEFVDMDIKFSGFGNNIERKIIIKIGDK